MSSLVTVEEMEALGDEIQKQKEVIAVITAELSEQNKKLEALEVKSAKYLLELGLKSYKSKHGTMTIIDVWRVSNPKSDEDKKALFAWLKENDIFEAYATVNNNSLNALYQQERDATIERDPMAALNFKLPGIGDPTLYQKVRFTKART